MSCKMLSNMHTCPHAHTHTHTRHAQTYAHTHTHTHTPTQKNVRIPACICIYAWVLACERMLVCTYTTYVCMYQYVLFLCVCEWEPTGASVWTRRNTRPTYVCINMCCFYVSVSGNLQVRPSGLVGIHDLRMYVSICVVSMCLWVGTYRCVRLDS